MKFSIAVVLGTAAFSAALPKPIGLSLNHPTNTTLEGRAAPSSAVMQGRAYPSGAPLTVRPALVNATVNTTWLANTNSTGFSNNTITRPSSASYATRLRNFRLNRLQEQKWSNSTVAATPASGAARASGVALPSGVARASGAAQASGAAAPSTAAHAYAKIF